MVAVPDDIRQEPGNGNRTFLPGHPPESRRDQVPVHQESQQAARYRPDGGEPPHVAFTDQTDDDPTAFGTGHRTDSGDPGAQRTVRQKIGRHGLTIPGRDYPDDQNSGQVTAKRKQHLKCRRVDTHWSSSGSSTNLMTANRIKHTGNMMYANRVTNNHLFTT